MKALMSPLARSILANPANKSAIREMFAAGHGRENGVRVTVTPVSPNGTHQEAITVLVYKVPTPR
jgi:hypothetical protein